MKRNCALGFTMVELMFAIAVIAILAAIGTVAYQMYTERSRAADILVKYDGIRSGVGAEVAQASISNCADVAQRLGTSNLADEYARLGYGFEAVTGGYRPVLTICAKLDRNGPLGVKVAREAHDTLAKTARVEKGAVLTETLVSFAVPLTDSDKPVCTVAPANPTTACGDPAPTQAAASNGCPPGKEPYTSSPISGATVRTCVDSCGPGQVRDPNNFRWCAPAPAVVAPPATVATPTPQASATQSITSCPPGQFLLDVSGGGGKQCWTPPPCQNANEVYYLGNQKCYPKPSTSCDQPSLLMWVDGTGPVCQDPSGGITELKVAQPATGSSVPTGSSGTSSAQGNAGSASASQTPAQRLQQCEAACRARFPHGNSRAYRSCIDACK
jgi:prepilin-type N-terminal cleavage/methylation domain-containing protein